ncbi:hypothetical protein VNI00_005156 [Paramarasmius palmivorus]|uniref:Uncharacterized protein n=1 Tax=Paramarasmius palmivorus TaxID=297713 RepID=A0AAW0DHR5_9AGAR
MSFEGCSNLAIHNSQFTNIQGSQHIHIQGTLIRYVQTQEEVTIWRDYKRIRTGDVYLTEARGTCDVVHEPFSDTGREVVAQRIFSVARILRGNKEEEFLHIGYTGRAAFETFKEDMDYFTVVKNVNVAQLFGYSDRHDLPAMIFYEALIPLARIARNMHTKDPLILLLDEFTELHGLMLEFSSLIFRVYCWVQLKVAQLLPDPDGPGLETATIWIDPSSGAFRTGPRFGVQTSPVLVSYNWYLPAPNPNHLLQALPIRECGDINAVTNYVSRMFSIEDLLDNFISMSSRYSEYTETLSRLSALPGFLTGCRTILYEDDFAFSMEFTREPSYVNITGYCGYRERRSGKYCQSVATLGNDATLLLSFPGFVSLILEPVKTPNGHEGDYAEDAADIPVYLCVRSLPQLSDDEAIWKAWGQSGIYYWSSDPTGQDKMSESKRISYNLPRFSVRIELERRFGRSGIWEDIERIHRVKGFDPKTTALAQSLGYPIIQTVRTSLDDTDPNDTDILEYYGVNVCEDEVCSSVSSISNGTHVLDKNEDDDEDIILYPRMNGGVPGK